MVKIVSFFVLFIILFLNVPLIGEAKTTGYSSSKGSNTAIKSPAQKSNGSKNKSTNQSNNSTNKTNSNKNNTSFPTTLLTAAGVYLLLDSITDDGEPDAEALVIDKKEVNNSTADQLMMTPFMVGNMTLTTASIIPGTTSSSYSLKLYVDEQNYNIAVPRDIFEKKSIGSKMRVKIFEDRLLSLE